MNSLDIVNTYYSGVVNLVGNIPMILYGSTVYGIKTSDLDICFLCNKQLSETNFQKLKNYTHNFHEENGLRIDEEVPYDNKMIYTYDFIRDTFNESPFPYVNGRFTIPVISKEKEFLCSMQMRKRLLLNILTVKHQVIGGCLNEKVVEKYSDQAWELILKTVISYSQKNELTFEEILDLLYTDPFNGNTGEMYLGYKDNLKEKLEFIKNTVCTQLNKLDEQDKVYKTLSKRYIPNDNWLKLKS